MATKTKTIVFTDLANYTMSTAKATQDEIRKLIEEHESHTKKIFDPYGGVLVKNLGDSFMAVFDSATAALQACMEIVETRLSIGDRTMGLRASLTTGDVEEMGGDYFGEAVNLSARINSKTPAGECWFANHTRLCMNEKSIPYETVGIFEFKGIPDNVECFRAVPPKQCILPDAVAERAKLSILQVVDRSHPPKSRYNRDDVIVIVGYEIGTTEFDEIVARFPKDVPPSQIHLLATNLPGLERKEWLARGFGLIIGQEAAFRSGVKTLEESVIQEGSSQTLFMDFGSQMADVLVESIGFALRNPISGLIKSYHYDFLKDKSWGFSDGVNGILKVEVFEKSAQVTAYTTGVSIDGRSLQPGLASPLTGDCVFSTPVGLLQYKTLESRDYQGIITGSFSYQMEALLGDQIEFGREPNSPGYVLNERGNPNGIIWASGKNAQMAKTNNYTLDRVIVGRQQAKLHIKETETYDLTAIHKRIPTFVVQGSTLKMLLGTQTITSGAEVIIGTTVVQVRGS